MSTEKVTLHLPRRGKATHAEWMDSYQATALLDALACRIEVTGRVKRYPETEVHLCRGKVWIMVRNEIGDVIAQGTGKTICEAAAKLIAELTAALPKFECEVTA